VEEIKSPFEQHLFAIAKSGCKQLLLLQRNVGTLIREHYGNYLLDDLELETCYLTSSPYPFHDILYTRIMESRIEMWSTHTLSKIYNLTSSIWLIIGHQNFTPRTTIYRFVLFDRLRVLTSGSLHGYNYIRDGIGAWYVSELIIRVSKQERE